MSDADSAVAGLTLSHDHHASKASSASSSVAIHSSRTQFYAQLLKTVRRTLLSTRDATASMANVAALIYHSLHKEYGVDSVNWCGFYLSKTAVYASGMTAAAALTEPVLILGPFHGQAAVTIIPFGRGVCGTCLAEKRTQLVPDVHAHPNHIACDSRSQSEIVVPLLSDDGSICYGMIDMDSPIKHGFTEEDQVGIEAVARLLVQHIDWTSLTSTLTLDEPLSDDVTCASNGAH